MFSLLVFISLASTAWTSNFSTTGCVDAAGTATCFQKSIADVTAGCKTACASNPNGDCLIACLCEGYKERINCALSSCWNKVGSRFRRPLMLLRIYKIIANTNFSRFIPAITNNCSLTQPQHVQLRCHFIFHFLIQNWTNLGRALVLCRFCGPHSRPLQWTKLPAQITTSLSMAPVDAAAVRQAKKCPRMLSTIL
jgi:hypothetical protein